MRKSTLSVLAAAMVASAGLFSAHAVDYTLNPAPGEVTDLMTIELSFPNDLVVFYENNPMAVATLENTTTGTVYYCNDADRNTHAEAMSAYSLTFIGEDEEEAAPIILPGDYTLTIRAMYIPGEEDGEMTDVDPITANYVISYPVEYALTPAPGTVTEFTTVSIEFPKANNVEFYENNQMAVAVLENTSTGNVYLCQEATRNTHAETEGIVYEFVFTPEGDEEAVTVTEPGNYLLTIKALALNNDGELESLPVITAEYVLEYPVEYTLTPAEGAVSEFTTISIDFPKAKNVEFYENNQMAVAVLENTTTGSVYLCQEATRNAHAETEGIAYDFVFTPEGEDEVVTVTEIGNYLLTIKALALNNDGELESLPVITAEYSIDYPVEYGLSPTPGVPATDLMNISIEFPNNNNIAFYENNQMPVAVLENLTTGTIYNCQEANRNTHAETEGIVYEFVFIEEDSEEAAPITLPGEYQLTIRAMGYEEDGEITEALPVIVAKYTIEYPVEYVIEPFGNTATNLKTVTIEFPNNRNIEFYENNQMPVAVLENLSTGVIYNCQEAERNTFAETDGIVYVLNFIEEDAEEIADITAPGAYLLTIRALAMVEDEEYVDLPVITKGYTIVYPYDYFLTPANGEEVKDLSTVTIEFPTTKVGFYTENRMPVATLVNNETEETFVCYEPDQDTFAQTEGSVWNLVFKTEDDEMATVNMAGQYTLTIKGMYTEVIEDGEVVETIDLPVIYASYEIGFPVDFILNPHNGEQVDNLQTVTLEFPETKNVAFYENNQMPVAVLENVLTGIVYNCQEAERNTFAETDGIVFVLNFIEEDAEEAAPIVDDGIYELTVRALYLTDEEDNEVVTLPVITATYYITDSGVKAAEMIGADSFNVYNMNGVKLVSNGKATDLDGLASGIYIINGKKVLIRK